MRPCHTRCRARRGDFAWLLNSVLNAKDLNLFPISCFAVDIRMFQPQCFMCACTPPETSKTHTRTHTWDTYIITHMHLEKTHTHTGI